MPRVPWLRTTAFAFAFVAAVYATTLLDSGTDSFVSVVGSALRTINTPVAPATPEDGTVIYTDISSPYVSPEKSVLPAWSQSLDFVDHLLLPFVVIGLVGGLPIALCAVVADRQRRQRSENADRLPVSLCYAGLTWQTVSALLSGLIAVLFAPAGLFDRQSPLLFYFAMQLVLGTYAIPCWRRLLQDASRARLQARIFLNAA